MKTHDWPDRKEPETVEDRLARLEGDVAALRGNISALLDGLRDDLVKEFAGMALLVNGEPALVSGMYGISDQLRAIRAETASRKPVAYSNGQINNWKMRPIRDGIAPSDAVVLVFDNGDVEEKINGKWVSSNAHDHER